jgi:hypothetical protein
MTLTRNFSRLAVSLSFVAALYFALPPAGLGATITLDSSGSVTFLDSGSTVTDFPMTLTAADFTAAQTGTPAFVQTSTPYWFTASDIPGAVWIGTNATASTGTGDTALYAVSFDLPSGVSAASLSIDYGVDNDLGDTNAGIFINGTALPESTGIPCGSGVACDGSFTTVNTYNDPAIASLLDSGTNWLYFDAVNLGDPGGLIFSADITYTPAAVATPEPSLALVIALGIGALALRRMRSAREAESR